MTTLLHKLLPYYFSFSPPVFILLSLKFIYDICAIKLDIWCDVAAEVFASRSGQ